MQNPKLSKFIATLNANKIEPIPRFKIGDVILCYFQERKIVSEVVAIHGEKYKDQQYEMCDLVNEFRTTSNYKYNRQKYVQNIDAKYSLVDKNVAQVLYKK